MKNNEKKPCHSNKVSVRERPLTGKAKRLEEGYIQVTGLLGNTTEEYVRRYFAGLDVVDVFFRVNKRNCRSGTALVKFAGASHTAAALKFNSKKRPLKLQLVPTPPWLKDTVQDKDVEKQGENDHGPPPCPCYVRVLNLPECTTKDDLKKVVVERETEDSQITFVTGEGTSTTKEAFIVLEDMEHLQQCLRKNQTILHGHAIYIFPSSEGQIRQLLKTPGDLPSLKTMPKQEEMCSHALDEPSQLKCMYVRNFPANVSKLNIQEFFAGFNVNQEDIFLLYDDNGAGMGEALVKFSTEHAAISAERLHQQPFLGISVLLLRISEEQIKHFDDLLHNGK